MDDEPAEMRDWLARVIAGDGMVTMAMQSRGASNAKAEAELGWTPRYPSWREGFRATYGAAAE